MKKLRILLYVVGCTLAWQSPAWAAGSDSGKSCTPTNIQYCKKGSTWSGKKYTTYTVRCSDGTKRLISAWNKRKKWCVGEKQSKCTKSQLAAAKRACRGG
jgi:hypothetical protein